MKNILIAGLLCLSASGCSTAFAAASEHEEPEVIYIEKPVYVEKIVYVDRPVYKTKYIYKTKWRTKVKVVNKCYKKSYKHKPYKTYTYHH